MTHPLIVTGARVHTTPERSAVGDLHVAGALLPADPGAEPPQESTDLIDGSGASVVPLLVDTVFEDAEPPAPDSFDLTPGRPATFAVIRGRVSSEQITTSLVVRPPDLIAVVVDGRVVVRDGAPSRPAGSDPPDSASDPRLGAWTDHGRKMTQYLTADGRYTETRHGRRDAYTGRFWLDGHRITYLDDTGFWAFGQYHRGILHHAGYVLRPGNG